jgi:hypothetical protein
MYKPMVFLHWKQVRFALTPFTLASFGLPLLTINGMGSPAGTATASIQAYQFLSSLPLWLPFFPALAVSIGVTLALSAWNWDHQFNHVYALSLPVTRWEYTVSKMVAGALLALIPVAGMWVGANLAAASISLPDGLNAYPNQLAVRFAFAILLVYSGLFAMAAGTVKTTMWIATAVVSFLIFGNVATELLATQYEWFARTNLVEQTLLWMLDAPGPLEVFTGSWSLIDV